MRRLLLTSGWGAISVALALALRMPAAGAPAAENPQVQALLDRIQNPDPNVRVVAQREARAVGAAAVVPLGALLASTDRSTAKAAGEALKGIVYHATRPGAAEEAKAVSQALTQLLDAGRPRKVRAEATHLLGFVGRDEAVPPLARLLDDPELREEARLALERIPGRASTRALERALRTAPPEFRPNLEQSLRHKRVTMKTVGTERG